MKILMAIRTCPGKSIGSSLEQIKSSGKTAYLPSTFIIFNYIKSVDSSLIGLTVYSEQKDHLVQWLMW